MGTEKTHEQLCGEITEVSKKACENKSSELILFYDGHGRKPLLSPNMHGSTGGGDWGLNVGGKRQMSLIDVY